MNIEREKIRTILNEYLDGELTPQQADEVAAALAADSQLAAEYAELQATRATIGSLGSITAPPDMTERIMHATEHHIFRDAETPRRSGTFEKIFHVQVFAAAAVVLLAVGMGLYLINTLSKSQEMKPAVAIGKASPTENSAKQIFDQEKLKRDEATAYEKAISPKMVKVVPVCTQKLKSTSVAAAKGISDSRIAGPGSQTKITIAALEDKIRTKESDSRTAVADIKPVIEPEPSLAMNDYKSRENYDSAWEQHAKKTEEASPTLPQPAITPPVLKTPRPVGEIAAAGTPKKVNGMSFYKGDASGKAKTISSRAALAKSVAIGKTTQDMPDSRHTQNIIIETTNVGQTQMKLENYMKSNRIQIVSSQKFHEAAVVDARKSELNQNIQSLATWADKEPVKLEYHIKTSETQACQINADLAQNFPNAQNILPSIKNSGLAVRENDGERMRGKLAESNLADSSVTNAIDANPIMMTITIQQRSQNQAIPTATCKPASVTTSAPATQPLSQPTTAPAK